VGQSQQGQLVIARDVECTELEPGLTTSCDRYRESRSFCKITQNGLLRVIRNGVVTQSANEIWRCDVIQHKPEGCWLTDSSYYGPSPYEGSAFRGATTSLRIRNCSNTVANRCLYPQGGTAHCFAATTTTLADPPCNNGLDNVLVDMSRFADVLVTCSGGVCQTATPPSPSGNLVGTILFNATYCSLRLMINPLTNVSPCSNFCNVARYNTNWLQMITALAPVGMVFTTQPLCSSEYLLQTEARSLVDLQTDGYVTAKLTVMNGTLAAANRPCAGLTCIVGPSCHAILDAACTYSGTIVMNGDNVTCDICTTMVTSDPNSSWKVTDTVPLALLIGGSGITLILLIVTLSYLIK